jgi:hypothetical protein
MAASPPYFNALGLSRGASRRFFHRTSVYRVGSRWILQCVSILGESAYMVLRITARLMPEVEGLAKMHDSKPIGW